MGQKRLLFPLLLAHQPRATPRTLVFFDEIRGLDLSISGGASKYIFDVLSPQGDVVVHDFFFNLIELLIDYNLVLMGDLILRLLVDSELNELIGR